MSEILDRGSLLFASVAMLVVSWFLAGAVFPFRFYMPFLVLAAFYVPGALLLIKLLGGVGGTVSAVLARDYSPLLTCAAMAWTAANLPLLLAGRVFEGAGLLAIAGIAYFYFAALMFFAVRTVFGSENRTAAGVVGLSWIPLLAAVFLWGPLQFLLRYLASPFFLFYAWYFLGGEIGNLGSGLRSRQNFRRMLDAATVNPHDGEAQYQLGLIHQQRHQYAEAIRRFQNAIAIDAGETDAHFQLGRIARDQGRLEEALGHFQTVLRQDPKHSQSEILRELGATNISLGRFAEAARELGSYVDRRPYDPEGLFAYGQALEALANPAEAREMYERAIEAARTAPRYRRRVTARWSRLAQKQLRKLAG